MKAFIFAAGLGTRLRPLTLKRPKALVEVGGKPLIRWLLERLERYGFRDVVVNVHYLGAMVEEYVRAYAASSGIRVAFSEEFDLLRDTGGGIRHAKALLDDGEPVLVHNADIVSNLDLGRLYSAAAVEFGADPLRLAKIVVSGRYSDRRFVFGSGDMRLRGWVNVKTGERKTAGAYGEVVGGDGGVGEVQYPFAGIHVISPRIFPLLEAEAARVGERFSIVDFYLKHASRYKIVGDYEPDLQLVDVGRLDHIPLAEDFIKRHYDKTE